MKTIITFGTFDLFHEGHLNILERAKKMGDYLVVGVSSDEFNYRKKQRYPVIPQKSRMDIVRALKCVDEVFLEESMEEKQAYIQKHNASIFTIGDDWRGKFDMGDTCEIIYLPRTEGTSTTEILKKILAMSR